MITSFHTALSIHKGKNSITEAKVSNTIFLLLVMVLCSTKSLAYFSYTFVPVSQ